MSKYNVVDNTELVDEVERGLKKGYWDKALIPELKKRFKEIENKEKLLNKIKEIIDRHDDSYLVSMMTTSSRYCEIEKLVKELENNEN